MAHVTLVPTPIGNLGDITLRALEVLRAADVVAAEDTRHSGKLLRHYGIDRSLVRLDAHTVLERAPKLLDTHASLAYLTDAGTPGISDPGADLLRLALARGDTVEVLPGATALIPALISSGLPSAQFAFEGFLPRKGGARKARLERLKRTPYTTIIYEAPARLVATLRELGEVLGPERQASVSRELSKLHEETRRGTLAELLEHFAAREVRGEVVVVVGPAEEAEDEVDWMVRAEALVAQGLEGKALQKALQALGAPRNEAYELALRFKS